MTWLKKAWNWLWQEIPRPEEKTKTTVIKRKVSEQKITVSAPEYPNPKKVQGDSLVTPTPPWYVLAKTFIGLREVKGKKHHPKIVTWWEKIKTPFRDDETPWCAAYVGAMLEDCGIKSTRSAAARSYNNWGQKLDTPTLGCIVVLWRGKPDGWSGHVGFFAGFDAKGNILILGGNQGDAVNIKAFPKSRLLSYRWANGYALFDPNTPIITADVEVSNREA